MRDICEKTGAWLEGEALLSQKLARILLTKRGSRPVIRDFGTNLKSLVDLPLNEFKVHATQEIFQTLEKYVPEFLCHSVEYEAVQQKVAMILKGELHKRKVEHALST